MKVTRVSLTMKPYGVRTYAMYRFIYRHQNEMKQILNETRHLEAIGLVLSEMIF